MDGRQLRGLEIASVCKLQKKGGVWLVPSQSGLGKYTVCPDSEKPHCTCQDHETRGVKCKHIFAVEYVLDRARNPDGSVTVTDSIKITERKTYPQNWRAYNAAQTHEQEKFQQLLHDLCTGIVENRPQGKRGRPSLLLADILFICAFKVYSTFSSRRYETAMREAHAKGYLNKLPTFNSVNKYMEHAALTPLLHTLITETALPLRAFEEVFAVDSSGFTTSRFIRWHDHKYGVVRRQHDWVKVHLTSGVRTNIVTAVEIKDRDAADTKLLPALVNATAKNFRIKEITADKIYGSISNYEVIASHGAVPYIPFKSIHTGSSGGLWSQMFHYFNFKRDEFLSHYHKRSNVESTFAMIKAKFRDHVRSKTDVAMVNEVLCKILCHNICVLIQEMYELGIEPVFWEKKEEEKVG